MNTRLNQLILLAILAAPSAVLASCSTQNIEPASIQTPKDCRESARLFDWHSIQTKTLSWAKETGRTEDGTLTIVFAIQNTDPLPHALSNSGGGFLYSVEYSLKSDDGTVYAATDASGIVTANNLHFAIGRDRAEEGTLKFKVRKGNYSLIFARKFDGKPVAKYDFSCSMAVS